jgi:hypothetical protein
LLVCDLVFPATDGGHEALLAVDSGSLQWGSGLGVTEGQGILLVGEQLDVLNTPVKIEMGPLSKQMVGLAIAQAKSFTFDRQSKDIHDIGRARKQMTSTYDKSLRLQCSQRTNKQC